MNILPRKRFNQMKYIESFGCLLIVLGTGSVGISASASAVAPTIGVPDARNSDGVSNSTRVPVHIVPKPGAVAPTLTPGHETSAKVNVAELMKTRGRGTPQKGTKLSPEGTWKWTGVGGNGQKVHYELKVAVAKGGQLTGILADNGGGHPIVDPVVVDDYLQFRIYQRSPGQADVPVDFTVKLDSVDTKVSIDRPDFTPAGKALGRKTRQEAIATQFPKG